MPEVSRFFGITIRMFYNDHQPAHFHAFYGGEQALLEIDGLRVIRGSLPPRVLGLVIEWAFAHRDGLRQNWDLARSNAPLMPIAPLT